MSSVYEEIRDNEAEFVGEGVHLFRDEHISYLKKGIRSVIIVR